MLIRLLFIAFLLVLVGRAARTLLGSPHKKPGPESPRPLVVDPVCGLYIDPADALSARDLAGQSVYFCSGECRDRYLSSHLPLRGSGKASPPDGD